MCQAGEYVRTRGDAINGGRETQNASCGCLRDHLLSPLRPDRGRSDYGTPGTMPESLERAIGL